ncbi:putative bifunctional diguanylate cyclase/phosphodiesterase [Microvirga lotononidis]|uniref:Diguanylate cyclase (GGDEF) domain-containing protein n=1 Tax=Microvirga lotononidis TaxID=864069 RepID=I4YQX2_9HYPH|nr:EAL domain-containing protein [Microvirga lotononidis]EIM26364.1 diguanylate cyclase (GGDEF) domain-containing protein [Microvirga lotononidis]
MTSFHQMRRRPARWIVLLGCFVAGSATLGAGFVSVILYNKDISSAENTLRNLSLVLAEQTERAFQSIDLSQQTALQALDGLEEAWSHDLKTAARTYSFYQVLVNQVEQLPHVEALTLVDDKGRLLNSSRSWPIPEMDVSDRPYFKAFRDNPDLQLMIGEPAVSRVSGTLTVLVVRRMTGPSREFTGLIISAIALDYFQTLYREIALLPERAVTLARSDGALLVRYPEIQSALTDAHSVRLNSPRAFVGRAGGVTRSISVLDGKDRIIAVQNLKRYPLVLLVSDTVETALSTWYYQAALLAAIAALMDVAVAMACLLGVRQIRATAKRAEAESFLARHDTLTGLPNRILFNEEIERTVREAKQSDRTFAVLLLDLDGFKEVNDTLGHQAGDELLRNVGARLRACIRKSDLIARIGGDEFAVVQRDVEHPDETSALARRLIETMRAPYRLYGDLASIGISVGIAFGPDGDQDADQLMRRADLALYSAKREGRGTFRLYEPKMDEERLARRALERDLARAVEAGELELFYQPIFDLRTDLVVGFEGLLRWRHARHGLVSPHEFIPIAEETGLIGPIGEWVIQQACHQAANWPASIKVAVNLSPVQFKTGDVMAAVTHALASSGLPAERLELEVTESTLLDAGAVGDILQQVKTLGATIALDDFGTGYASMSSLRSFPFDKIKIDQSFVQEMNSSSGSAAIVYATLDLARRLGIATTAEGVETEEQLGVLRAAGCTTAQGYLIGKPMQAEHIPSFLVQSEVHPLRLQSSVEGT